MRRIDVSRTAALQYVRYVLCGTGSFDAGREVCLMEAEKVEKKRRKEQEAVEQMIRLYCRGNRHSRDRGKLCPECQELLDYARARSERCPFMENKTFCNNCKVHCYKPEMRKKIRAVMRYSGPRMLLHRPGLALWHVICSKREEKKE